MPVGAKALAADHTPGPPPRSSKLAGQALIRIIPICSTPPAPTLPRIPRTVALIWGHKPPTFHLRSLLVCFYFASLRRKVKCLFWFFCSRSTPSGSVAIGARCCTSDLHHNCHEFRKLCRLRHSGSRPRGLGTRKRPVPVQIPWPDLGGL